MYSERIVLRILNECGEALNRSHEGVPCLVWTGTSAASGYNAIYVPEVGKYVGVYRIAWELANGKEMPDDLVPDHLCRFPPCIEPRHLEAVTQGENLARGRTAAVINREKTHCAHGHEYSAENTRVYRKKNGGSGRACKTCERERYLARKTLT
jgi:hypothetical protein